jgi:hypothetical protein
LHGKRVVVRHRHADYGSALTIWPFPTSHRKLEGSTGMFGVPQPRAARVFLDSQANPEALFTVKLSEDKCLSKRQILCWRKRVLRRSTGPGAEYHHFFLAREVTLNEYVYLFLAMDGE